MQAKDLEQKTSIEILLLLLQRNELKWTEILKILSTSQHPAYKARQKLVDSGLMKELVSSYPPKRIFTLTERGCRVAEKLAEIERILLETSERDGNIITQTRPNSRAEILKEDLDSRNRKR